ncbi:MAG TPA: hypothetical protein VE621_10065 [Bryobacteraceae bacterium]|nr:hypothetical protein [Bryobacteraceae bacterium]
MPKERRGGRKATTASKPTCVTQASLIQRTHHVSLPKSNYLGDQYHVRRLALLACLIGAGVRTWLWWISYGSNDVTNWIGHAERVLQIGLVEAYRTHTTLNHPPIFAEYAALSWKLAQADTLWFARLIKLPGLCGEALILWALWRYRSPAFVAVYATAPAGMLVSAYHGNTDTLCGALAMLSGLLFEKRAYLIAGLLLAAALNVKLMALVLVPVLLLAIPNLRALAQGSLGFAIGSIPFLLPAVRVPREMYRNMLAYGSNPDNWGLLAFLNPASETQNIAPFFAPIRDAFLRHGRYWMFAAIVIVSILARYRFRWSMPVRMGLAAALFLILAPGFGVQYVGFVAPLVMAASLRHGALWGWLSGIFAGLVYWIFLTSTHPVASVLTRWYPEPASMVGLVSWAGLIYFVYAASAEALSRQQQPVPSQAEAFDLQRQS